MRSKRKYPRIGMFHTKKPKGRCRISGEVGADANLDIEINEFRGDDEVFNIHAVCADPLDDDELIKACLDTEEGKE